jgi:hypothetical protein
MRRGACWCPGCPARGFRRARGGGGRRDGPSWLVFPGEAAFWWWIRACWWIGGTPCTRSTAKPQSTKIFTGPGTSGGTPATEHTLPSPQLKQASENRPAESANPPKQPQPQHPGLPPPQPSRNMHQSPRPAGSSIVPAGRRLGQGRDGRAGSRPVRPGCAVFAGFPEPSRPALRVMPIPGILDDRARS